MPSLLPLFVVALMLEQSPPLPDAVVDLRTTEGAARVQAEWRYSDAPVIDVEHRAPAADNTPTGAANRTHDIARPAEGDWTVVAPDDLERRRTSGRLSFGWYHLSFTIPATLGSLDVRGTSITFEVVADDYAEVWLNGAVAPVLGQSGGSMVAGWNAPNRVLITDHALPGARVDLRILCANAPLSNPPPNYVWLRSATLDVVKAERAAPPVAPLTVERLDPALDAIVPSDARLEKLADGFGFAEGPLWLPQSASLLFSDPNKNVMHRLAPDGTVSIYRTKSGYAGIDIGAYRQPGSNGLALDGQGRITVCEHGNRRVTRLEANGAVTVLADRFEGKRLNSPNDLVYRSDGALFFTDPFFGLPQFDKDPRKELPHQGVYCLKDGTLSLLTTELMGPNGIALSPDESRLYVANWDERRKIVMRYDLAPDASVSNAAVFCDLTSNIGEEALDGLEVDEHGNVYVSGPGGVSIFAASGRLLGRLVCPELPANFAWGGNDGKSLYLAARTGIYRIRLSVAGSTAPTMARAEAR